MRTFWQCNGRYCEIREEVAFQKRSPFDLLGSPLQGGKKTLCPVHGSFPFSVAEFPSKCTDTSGVQERWKDKFKTEVIQNIDTWFLPLR